MNEIKRMTVSMESENEIRFYDEITKTLQKIIKLYNIKV